MTIEKVAEDLGEGKPRRNWWKVAFFVALIAFEGAREVAVLAKAEPVSIATMNTVVAFSDQVSANGRWKRIDGGSRLAPSAVSIRCWRNKNQCVEASIFASNGNYVSQPDIAVYDATFAADGVSYVNDDPTCARYSVRIDLKLEKVFAVRERKDSKTKPCDTLEPRIEMTLGDGFDPDDEKIEDHFVPFLAALGWGLKFL